jgi:hypothetical protein
MENLTLSGEVSAASATALLNLPCFVVSNSPRVYGSVTLIRKLLSTGAGVPMSVEVIAGGFVTALVGAGVVETKAAVEVVAGGSVTALVGAGVVESIAVGGGVVLRKRTGVVLGGLLLDVGGLLLVPTDVVVSAAVVLEVVGDGVVVVVDDVVASAVVEVVGHTPPSHRQLAEHPSPDSVFPSSHSSIPNPGLKEVRDEHTGNITIEAL